MSLSQLEQQFITRDAQRLKAHFARVVRRLQKRDISHLSPEMQAARSRNIDHLQKYAAEGVFPHNPYLMQQPCFVDRQGRACAVAYLLLANHQHEAVKQIHERENFAFVPEMQSPLLQDWIADSGFTAQEVKEIQPSYIGAPTSVEFMQQLGQITEGVRVIGDIAYVLVLVAVVIGSLNVSLLFRRRIGLRLVALGMLNAALLLSSAIYFMGQLRIVYEIRSVICTNPKADCSAMSFHLPQDLDLANKVQLKAAFLLVMAIFFTLVVLLPSLAQLLWANKKRRT